jgi:hypothetical protein
MSGSWGTALAYVELRYYRAYALEIRELGDTGWAVHVYAPDHGQGPLKLTVITTTVVTGLEGALADARSAVDQAMQSVPPD